MLNHPDFGPLYAGPVTLPDGRIAYVCPLTFDRARLQVGTADYVEDGY
jgi:hypothetical protein